MVSLMIILAAVSGIFAGFVATQKYVSRSKRRTAVINYVRQQLDTRKTHIRKDTWDDPSKNLLYAPAGQSKTYTAKTSFPNLKIILPMPWSIPYLPPRTLPPPLTAW